MYPTLPSGCSRRTPTPPTTHTFAFRRWLLLIPTQSQVSRYDRARRFGRCAIREVLGYTYRARRWENRCNNYNWRRKVRALGSNYFLNLKLQFKNRNMLDHKNRNTHVFSQTRVRACTYVAKITERTRVTKHVKTALYVARTWIAKGVREMNKTRWSWSKFVARNGC